MDVCKDTIPWSYHIRMAYPGSINPQSILTFNPWVAPADKRLGWLCQAEQPFPRPVMALTGPAARLHNPGPWWCL